MSVPSKTRNWYGIPLDGTSTSLEGVCQFSPLIPGSHSLADAPVSSLSNFSMLAPFGTLERRYALALVLQALLPGARVCASAPKTKGGARIKKELTDFGCTVVEESRSHHRVCTAARPQSLLQITEAIGDGAPRRLASSGLWSQPGIFSWDRLDPGTSLLLEHLPSLHGSGADLGCGIGYLGQAALSSPAVTAIQLIDIDRRATECARQNIPDPRASFIWEDVRAVKLRESSLDFVVMNPPFHDGGMEDRNLGQDFIKLAHSLLKADGQCWLTANKHLPYEPVLQNLFKGFSVIAENKGYKVIRALK